MSDFDDLFNFDDDSSAKKPAEKKPAQATPSADDDILSDFQSPPASAAPANKPATQEDDFFGDSFGEDAADVASSPAIGETEELFDRSSVDKPAEKNTQESDDLFADFLKDEAPSPKTASAPPPRTETIPSAPIAPPREQNLEDLFDESSLGETEKSGENTLLKGISSDLAPEYQVHKRKLTEIIPPKIMMMVAGAVLILTGSILSVARFADNGFLGWKLGGRSGDEYSPPSSWTLDKLSAQYKEASALFLHDALTSYQDAILRLDKILQTDKRNYPTLPRLAEALLYESGGSLNQKARKRVETLLADAGTFYPDKIETLRAKARLKLIDHQLNEAENLAKKAKELNSKDPESLTLLGEISFKREQMEQAREFLNFAVELEPTAARAKFFTAMLDSLSNNKPQAEATLKALAEKTPAHPRSQLELLKLWDESPDKSAMVKVGLEDLIKNKGPQFSDYDLGKAYRYLAEIAERASDRPEAIKQMEESIKKDPLNDENGFYLGMLYLDNKDYDKAVERLAHVVTIAPNRIKYLVTLGRANRLAGKADQGIIEVKRGLEVDPNDIEGIYELGMNQRALRRNEEAISSFDLALQKRPNFPEAMIELAELHLDRDNFIAAEGQLKSLLELQPQNVRALEAMGKIRLIQRKSGDALAFLKKAETLEPENTRILNQLVDVYLFMDKKDLAAEYVSKSEKINPGLVETQIQSAQLWLAKKEPSKAAEILTRIIQNNPKNAEARVVLAKVHTFREEFQEAVSECQEGFKYRPDSYDLKLQIGIAWRGVGDLEQSITYIKMAIQGRPSSADAYYQLELSQIYRNDIPNAEISMDKALQYDPTFIDPLVAMGDYYKGRSQYDLAAKFYQNAVKIQPNNPKILLALAEMYRNEGNNARAIKFYKLTTQAQQGNVFALLGLGMIAEENKEITQAANYYEAAKSADPFNPRPHYYLGLLYKQMGKRGPAIAALKKYLELDPGSKEKEDIGEIIAKLASGK